MRIEALKQEVIEEGRSHPFVEALVKELKTRREFVLSEMEGQTNSIDVSLGPLCALGGRAFGLRETLRLILNAKGINE